MGHSKIEMTDAKLTKQRRRCWRHNSKVSEVATRRTLGALPEIAPYWLTIFRSAPNVMRSSDTPIVGIRLMRRAVALLLLISYGLPAAAGRYWHHHDGDAHRDGACGASDDAQSSHASCRHVCGCGRSHEPRVAPAKSPERRPSGWHESHAESPHNCAICAFYSQATLAKSATTARASVASVFLSACFYVAPSQQAPGNVWARGPPSMLPC